MSKHDSTAPQQTAESRIWQRYIPAAFALVTILLYLPGLHWGLPRPTTPPTPITWGADEISPASSLGLIGQVMDRRRIGFQKYPLMHYGLTAGGYIPYLAYLKLSGNMVPPHPERHPFGFKDPTHEFQIFTILGRIWSLAMAAGTVIAAYLLARKLWGNTAGLLAGLFMMLMYPMNYYGVMSNVDGPALFWCSLALLVAAHILTDGWTVKRAAWFGAFAAAAIATKDQSYAVLLLVPFALVYAQARRDGIHNVAQLAPLMRPALAGLAVSVGVYAVTSGLLISPSGFKRHLDFILGADAGGIPSFWYFRYDKSLAGFLGLMREAMQQIVDTQGWILFVAAVAGAILCLARRQRGAFLLLTIPLLFVGVILPVRHTAIRFMLPVGFVLALYAAYFLAQMLASRTAALRALAALVIFSGAGLQIWRAADLLHVMHNDSRLAAAAWLEKYAQPGDRVEYFELAGNVLGGRLYRLPPMPNFVEPRNASATAIPGHGPMDGAFAITQAADDQKLHWFCPAQIYRGLQDGSLGYELAAVFDPPGRFSHEHLVLVSPRVEIYVRKDLRAARGVPAFTTARQ